MNLHDMDKLTRYIFYAYVFDHNNYVDFTFFRHFLLFFISFVASLSVIAALLSPLIGEAGAILLLLLLARRIGLVRVTTHSGDRGGIIQFSILTVTVFLL